MEFKAAAAQEIEDALAEAQKAPPPQPSQIFDHVFAELTPRQAIQRRELLGRD
jgi:pyruvate dehydrogenase E1 component alpha subunit